MEYWTDPIADDPLWVEIHKRSDTHLHIWLTYRRIDGLKLWMHFGVWRFKTADCGHGAIEVDRAWHPDSRLTAEQARAWCDEHIELHTPITKFDLLNRDMAQPG